MQTVSSDTFGPLVAYLVPGATALVGLSPFVPGVEPWFAGTTGTPPTIGGFLYLTVASLAVGMTVSAVRWAVLDTVHGLTGLPPPRLDFSRLGKNVEAMRLLIEIHYKHYLFYGNMEIAVAVAWAGHRTAAGWDSSIGAIDGLAVFLLVVFFATSRDTLRKYYVRSRQLLGEDTGHRFASARSKRRAKSGNPTPRAASTVRS